MKILLTGAAGFIGSAVCRRLIDRGDTVVGLDNINDYYDPDLKYGRLAALGIARDDVDWYRFAVSSSDPRFSFIRMNLEDAQAMRMLFANGAFDAVINLAAQAGVRYSITNPQAYIESNVDGFINILEGCRHNGVKHLVYASSSSVYGLNGKVPFSEHDGIAHPVSLYAATKKSNELMACVYSSLYGIRSTGLRFFTVYGPWGRPDMSPILFADAITQGRPIRLFNGGDMVRDFTYIDDIVRGTVLAIDNPPAGSGTPATVYNIGCSHPVRLMEFIAALERALGRKAQFEKLPMQPGDVPVTAADTSKIARELGYSPTVRIDEGTRRFAQWYESCYAPARQQP